MFNLSPSKDFDFKVMPVGLLCCEELVPLYSFIAAEFTLVEIKLQPDATDDFYCRSYCLLNMFRAPLCPSSGALVFKLSVWCGAEGHITFSSTT
jgi:hypothetical protein